MITREIPFKGLEGLQVAWLVVEKNEVLYCVLTSIYLSIDINIDIFVYFFVLHMSLLGVIGAKGHINDIFVSFVNSLIV